MHAPAVAAGKEPVLSNGSEGLPSFGGPLVVNDELLIRPINAHHGRRAFSAVLPTIPLFSPNHRSA
jgi:hypothetical protein